MNVTLVVEETAHSIVYNASSEEVTNIGNDVMRPESSKRFHHLDRYFMRNDKRVNVLVEVFGWIDNRVAIKDSFICRVAMMTIE